MSQSNYSQRQLYNYINHDCKCSFRCRVKVDGCKYLLWEKVWMKLWWKCGAVYISLGRARGSAAIKRWSQTSQMEQRVPFQCAGYFLKNLLHPPPCLPLPSLMNLQRPSSQGHDGLLITEYVESLLCVNGPAGHWDTESICWGPARLQIKTRPNRIQLQEGLRITAAARLKIVLLERKFTAKGWVCGLGPVSAAVLAATASIQLALLLSAGLLQSQR